MSHFETILTLHREKFTDLEQRLIKAIDQLHDEDVNWRSNDESNSIANIILHISGNLRQRFVAGIGGGQDTRDRDEEFNARESYTREQLIGMVRENFAITQRALQSLNSEMLDQVYTIQGRNVSALDVIFGVATHVSEHVGQILFIAKIRLGDRYQVIWMPHHRR